MLCTLQVLSTAIDPYLGGIDFDQRQCFMDDIDVQYVYRLYLIK